MGRVTMGIWRWRALALLLLVGSYGTVNGGKSSAEEISESSSSSKGERRNKDKEILSSEKYSASYPTSAISYYSTYGFPFANGGGSSESSKTNSYNPYLTDLPYDRNGKDFSTRTSNTMPMAMAASSNFGSFGSPVPISHSSHVSTQSKEVTGPEFGGLASASQGWGSSGGGGWGKGGGGGGWGGGGGGWGGGAGGGGGWGGGGGGWGGGGGGWGGGQMMKGGPQKGPQNDLNSPLGLIGLLLLLQLLQSLLASLTATTTTTMSTTTMMMMGGRKKRDTYVIDYHSTTPSPTESHVDKTKRISLMVLPSLNVIAHARDGKIPLECTHREVCVANSILVKELGWHGRSVASVISTAITKLLKELKGSGGIDKHVDKAGAAGRNGEDCTVVYPLCEALGKNGKPILPMLFPPERIGEVSRISLNHLKNARPNQHYL